MRQILGICTFLVLSLSVAADGIGATAHLKRLQELRANQLRSYASRDAVNANASPKLEKHPSPFLNPKSRPFAVNGTGLPLVNFDVGESYAGVLPISSNPNESRKLYFWFFPSQDPAASKEITIWLQGGPGGASTGGFLLENGPFVWQPGTAQPMRNTFAWNNLTNMVWIDQPVGTGFSVGTPNITNDYQLADQFMGFWKNFVDTFTLKGYKVYFTGESYAGYYIPYIANGFLQAKDTNYFNLKGTLITDPIIGNEVIQFEGVAMQYLNYWSNVFGFDATTMAKFTALNSQCGYDKYLAKYFRFPPPAGPFPGPFGNGNYGTNYPPQCDIQGAIITAAIALNPCFNFDHIYDTCPTLYSPEGEGIFMVNFNPLGPTLYFNRPDVRQAIHAPAGVNWSLSANENVFIGPNYSWESATGDASLPPAQIGILTKIIEATNNVIIGAGGLDFQLPANGTLFVLQNVTWNGVQGFSAYPNKTLFVPQYANAYLNSVSGYGDMGVWTRERGLTFFVNQFAGHEEPWYTPGVAYRVLQTLLGRIPNLSATGDF